MTRLPRTLALLGAAGVCLAGAAHAQRPYTTWRAYGGSASSAQYSALDQINKKNVGQLEVAWTFPTGQRSFTQNPLIVERTMYVAGGDNAIIALDAVTGKQLWSHPNEGGISARGFNYWQSADGSDRRIVYANAGFLTEIDARTGNTVTTFGTNGRVDLRDALKADGWDMTNVRELSNAGNPGRVYQNLFIISLPAQGAGYNSTPGDVTAWDIVTGKLAWIFHSIPHKGEFGYDTWPAEGHEKAGGVHNWSELTVDEANGIAFVPFGTARYDFFGGNRAGNNLFANSLVALDAKTGKRLWHQQLVHHDLWDYDLPQAPKLLTIKQNGRSRDVVAQATKHGFVFVFDRKTGEPVWPIEERPVPQSDLPGEHTSPTQPFPTKPPPFAVQAFTEKDINPFLPPAEQETLRQRLRTSRNDGLFTPPSFEGSIEMPGHNGGANWASSAVDPLNGEMYVVSKNLPVMLAAQLSDEEPSARGIQGAVIPPEQAAKAMADAKAAAAKGPVRYVVPYDFLRSPTNGLTAIKPPWSHITAYDLNTGEIKWRIPDGSTPGPGFPADSGSHFPRGAPLVTAGGLLFVATAQDKMLRAYDRDNGKVLWSREVPTGSEGIPATYEVDGRQYVVFPVAAGAGTFAPTLAPPPAGPQSDRAYIAFALKK
jgi:quinoprotein glucose dehydrogenase